MLGKIFDCRILVFLKENFSPMSLLFAICFCGCSGFRRNHDLAGTLDSRAVCTVCAALTSAALDSEMNSRDE
jgi:hypothetical protein